MIFPPSGDIKQLTIPWLFQSLRSQGKTGTAVVERFEVIKKVYFQNGDITFAASNLNNERLGESLLADGVITQAQYDVSAELLAASGKKQGAILVEQGALTPVQLVDGVKKQVKKIILSLFGWKEGRYRFDEGPLPMADIIPLHMSTGNVILEGVGALDWQFIKKSLPPPTAVMKPVTDPSALFQQANLTPDQRAILALADGKRSIEEICVQSGIGDHNAMIAVYVLLALRMIDIGAIKSKRDMAFARAAVRVAVSPQTAVPPPSQESPLAPQHQEPILPEVATQDMVDNAYAALEHQNYYQVLGIGRIEPVQHIKRAYLRLAKLYHPDRHFDPGMTGMKPKLDALFARINEAFQTLSNTTKRMSYDLTLDAQGRVTAAPITRSDEHAARPQDPAARAREQFNNGSDKLKSGDFWGAAEALQWAIRLDPSQAEYYYWHGIALSKMPRRLHDAEEDLLKAIELDRTKESYYLTLGRIYWTGGLKTRAIALFAKGRAALPSSKLLLDAQVRAENGSLEIEEAVR